MSTFRKQLLRFLKLLSKRMTAGFEYEVSKDRVIISAAKPLEFPLEAFMQLKREGLIELRQDRLYLSDAGLEQLRGCLRDTENSGSSASSQSIGSEQGQLAFNADESPLARLSKLKSKTGRLYFALDEVSAGERLRSDFECGNLQPRISANISIGAGISAKGSHAKAHEISDFALDARARVNNALVVLGPELSGVALDVCCFLKGLELVERERQWPSRSAKLMLKTALSALSRHYGFAARTGRPSSQIEGWGTTGFRPEI